MSLYTEKQLGETLRGLMRHKDLDSITVTELTGACRMNRKTFYYHFDGMDALVRDVIERGFQESVGDKMRLADWGEGFVATMGWLEANDGFLQAVRRSRYWPAAYECMVRIAYGAADVMVADVLGHIRDEDPGFSISSEDVERIARYYGSLAFASVQDWYSRGMHESPEEFQRTFTRLNRGGVAEALHLFAVSGRIV